MDFYKRAELATPSSNIYFGFVYLLAVIFTYHTLLVAYTTSTFIAPHLSTTGIGLLYAASAFISVLLFLTFPTILAHLGNVLTGVIIMLICIGMLFVMAYGTDPHLLIVAVTLFLAFNPGLYLTLDVLSETLIGEQEGSTGSKRGLILSLMSAAAVIAPLSMSLLMGDDENYSRLFLVAAGVGGIFIFMLVFTFRRFVDLPYERVSIRPLLARANQDKDIRTVMITHFLLQLFFAWMIIYVPLYLAAELGFSWPQIGSIIAVGLLAYVFAEYPIGLMADRFWGEKEMMAIGFLILALTTASLAFMMDAGVVGFMILMFASRVGASLVEVTTESYFFKKVRGGDASLMSLFRLLRPASNLLGALLGSLTLFFVSFELAFIIWGSIMVIGVFLTRYLTDTK
jgi:MFS family permease